MKPKLAFLCILFIVIMTSGFGCKFIDSATQQKMQPVTLNYWRVYDDTDAFSDLIKKYTELHPYITINYRKLRYDEFENELLNAMAEDSAPDIISIHNTWIRKYQNKITPMPKTVKLVYPIERGTIKKEVIPELRESKCMTVSELRSKYADIVYDDAVIMVTDSKTGQSEEKIFGLPLAIDTLSLYYNIDLLDNAGIAQPPKYWNTEFQQDVKKLTKQDINGKIVQSGVALGGSTNIDRFSDILSILMMQNGAVMQEGDYVTFHLAPPAFVAQKINPGLEALIFYTDFANPIKEVYSWNKDMDNSLEMFIQGRLGIMFGYSFDALTIKSRAPKLKFGISKLLQIEGSAKQINFANYWVETVTSKSKHPDEAWDFIQSMADEKNVSAYLDYAKKPTALRSLIDKQSEDQDIGIFASQVLTAKSWYRGKDPQAAELIIGEMIDSVNSGAQDVEYVINLGSKKVQQTIK